MDESLAAAPRGSAAQLAAAHHAFRALALSIPDAALDWQLDAETWSPKRIVAHVAHAYDFYLLIVEEARLSGFRAVRLRRGSPGYTRILTTDAAALACTQTAPLVSILDEAHSRAQTVLAGLVPPILDRPFQLDDSWQEAGPLVETTLRRRVLETAATHLAEHRSQLAAALAQLPAA